MKEPSLFIRWPDLAEACPTLGQFVRAAGEAARNGWRGWPSWVADYSPYRKLIRRAAALLGVDPDVARAAGNEHLETIHRRALQAAYDQRQAR